MVPHENGVMMIVVRIGNKFYRPSRGRGVCSLGCYLLIICIEDIQIKTNSGILHYALHDGLTGDGTIVRYIVVHATVGLTAVDAPCVEKATLVDVYFIGVVRMIHQMTPRDGISVIGLRKVLIESKRLICKKLT